MAFAPLGAREILGVVRRYHPLYSGVDEGLIAGFPVRCSNGAYEVVQGLELNDFSRSRLEVTVNELKEERETIKRLELVP